MVHPRLSYSKKSPKQAQAPNREQERLHRRNDPTQLLTRARARGHSPTIMTTDAAFLACFGPEADMEVDTPSQSLKKLLVAKSKEKSNSKRPRDKTTHTATTSKPTPETIHSADPVKHAHRSLWFGFDAMEKLAEENGQEPLFYEETIEDKITRGVTRVEAAELEQVSISFPRIPQLLYPNKKQMVSPDNTTISRRYPPKSLPTQPLAYPWTFKFQFTSNYPILPSFIIISKNL